jgi:hypothetical protein
MTNADFAKWTTAQHNIVVEPDAVATSGETWIEVSHTVFSSLHAATLLCRLGEVILPYNGPAISFNTGRAASFLLWHRDHWPQMRNHENAIRKAPFNSLRSVRQAIAKAKTWSGANIHITQIANNPTARAALQQHVSFFKRLNDMIASRYIDTVRLPIKEQQQAELVSDALHMRLAKMNARIAAGQPFQFPLRSPTEQAAAEPATSSRTTASTSSSAAPKKIRAPQPVTPASLPGSNPLQPPTMPGTSQQPTAAAARPEASNFAFHPTDVRQLSAADMPELPETPTPLPSSFPSNWQHTATNQQNQAVNVTVGSRFQCFATT